MELSCDDIFASPEMVKTKDHPEDVDERQEDKDLEALIAVESTAQACIMHALRIVSTQSGLIFATCGTIMAVNMKRAMLCDMRLCSLVELLHVS